MCLNTFFLRKIETMLPGERVSYSREDLERLLEERHCTPIPDAPPEQRADPSGSAPAPGRGFGTRHLAVHFGVSQSTARGWCQEGRFGDPGLLRPNGKTWEVPRVEVERVERLRAAGQGFKDGSWTAPVLKTRSVAPSAKASAAAPSPKEPGKEARSEDRSSGARQDSLSRTYSNWEQHMKG